MKIYKLKNGYFAFCKGDSVEHVRDTMVKQTLSRYEIPESEFQYAFEDLVEKQNDYMAFGVLNRDFLYTGKIEN